MKLKRGFTLIELLVVVAIIGILASVVLVSLNSARTKGADAKRISDIKQMQNALELYYSANGFYPTNAAIQGGNSILFSDPMLATELLPYLKKIPTDPKGASFSTYRYVSGPAGSTAPNTYGILMRYENKFQSYCSYAAPACGYCKIGVNMNPNWWAPLAVVPYCI